MIGPLRQALTRKAFSGLRNASVVPLISDPFDVASSVRETATEFPRPKFISFDAFGTLYDPIIPVAEQYRNIAKEYGIDWPVERIETRFVQTHRELSQEYPNYGKNSSEIDSCDTWWKELVIRVFELDPEKYQELSQRLVDHFTGPNAYKVYEDVEPTLKELQKQGVKMVVSTNSDTRITEVLKNLGLSQYFSNIHRSYDIGAEKPSKAFFDAVLRKERENKASLEWIWHVGDSREHDFIGGVRAGWNAVLLDRTKQSGYFGPRSTPEKSSPSCSMGTPVTGPATPDVLKIANNRVVMTSLTHLLQLYRFR